MAIHVSAPLSRAAAAALRAGDSVLLSGTVYTARDAAHRRFRALLEAGEPLPFPIEGAVLYYVGPTPAPPGPRRSARERASRQSGPSGSQEREQRKGSRTGRSSNSRLP